MSIRTRKWTKPDGTIASAIVVNWSDWRSGKPRRRLKTFKHMREARSFHAIVDGKRPAFVAALQGIKADLARNSRRQITLTRSQAMAIVEAFPVA